MGVIYKEKISRWIVWLGSEGNLHKTQFVVLVLGFYLFVVSSSFILLFALLRFAYIFIFVGMTVFRSILNESS